MYTLLRSLWSLSSVLFAATGCGVAFDGRHVVAVAVVGEAALLAAGKVGVIGVVAVVGGGVVVLG